MAWHFAVFGLCEGISSDVRWFSGLNGYRHVWAPFPSSAFSARISMRVPSWMERIAP